MKIISQLIYPILAIILLTSIATPSTAAGWSDTSIGYRTSNQYTEPAIKQDIHKDIFNLTHASGYKYGSNFFNVDMLVSDDKDKANASADGAQEIYTVYRHSLEAGKITGTPWAFGPVKDTALTFGFDFNAKDTTFAPRKRLFVIGPNFKIAVPAGFFDVGLFFTKEQNHNAFGTKTKDITFDASPMLSASWGIPFSAGSVPVKFQGFLNIIGQKGKDANDKSTATETLLRTSVMLDIGAVTYGTNGALYVGIGYEYWKNKFGNQPSLTGTETSAPTLNLEFHF